MNKSLIIAFAALSLAAGPVLAGDEKTDADTKMQTEGAMNPTAGSGAASNQPPGAETSDRTPEKSTTTPDTQVDRSESGETSDRTPEQYDK